MLLVDERVCCISGKGKATPSSEISLKCGAGPPKNAPRTTIGCPVAFLTVIRMHSSDGRGSCITLTIDPINELDKVRSISQTRSGRRRATMILLGKDLDFGALDRTTSGKVGQTSRVDSIAAPDLQSICRPRRRGDTVMTYRHLLHTCARRCHFHGRPRDCFVASSR